MKFVVATQELLNKYIETLDRLECESGLPIIWDKNSFLMPLDLKFDLSKLLFWDDLLVGYVIVSKKTNKSCHIHRFIIDKSFRNKGIGMKMIKNVEQDIFQKFDYLTLLVHSENTLAVNFYSKNAFMPIYKIAADILMVKNKECISSE